MQRTFRKHSKTSRAQHGPHSGSSGCLFYLKFISFSFRLFSVPACLAVAVAVAVSASPQLLSFMLCLVLFCFVLFYFVPLPLLLPLPASHLTWRGFYLSLGIYLILIKRNWLPDRNGGAWGVARWPWQEVWRVGEEAKVSQLLLEYVDSSGAFKLTHSPVALQLQGFAHWTNVCSARPLPLPFPPSSYACFIDPLYQRRHTRNFALFIFHFEGEFSAN